MTREEIEYIDGMREKNELDREEKNNDAYK